MARSATSSHTALPAVRRAAPLLALVALLTLVLSPGASAAEHTGRSVPVAHAVQMSEPAPGREADGRLSPASLHGSTALDRLTVAAAALPAAVSVGCALLLGFAASTRPRHVARRHWASPPGRAPPGLAATA